jgi:hypothetical protein
MRRRVPCSDPLRLVIDYIRRRSFLVFGLLLGLAIFLVLFFRQENTNNRVTHLQTQVKVIRETSPCTDLTTAECAYKLLRALPAEQRESIRVSEKTLERLKQKAQHERRLLEEGKAQRGANGRIIEPTGDTKATTTPQQTGSSSPSTPIASTPPSTPSRPPVSAPVAPSAPSSTPPTTTQPPTATGPSGPVPPAVTTPSAPPPPRAPDPILQTPTIRTPPIGPIPPVMVPPIKVPCYPAKPLLTCDDGGR